MPSKHKHLKPDRKKISKKEWLDRSLYAHDIVKVTDFFKNHIEEDEVDYMDSDSVKDACGKFCFFMEDEEGRWKHVFNDLDTQETTLARSLIEKVMMLAKYRARHSTPRNAPGKNS